MSARDIAIWTAIVALVARSLALDGKNLSSPGLNSSDRDTACEGLGGCPDNPAPYSHPPPLSPSHKNGSISKWNDSACVSKPATESIPSSTTSNCFNFGNGVSGLLIDWGTNETWATIFNDLDCNSPSNLTITRETDSLCQPVADGYGGVNQANIPGNPGSILMGTGKPPPQISPFNVDGDNLGMLTTCFGYEGCNDAQKIQINQAQQDAVLLATNAVKSPGIDFGYSPAALEYFGPPDETQSQGVRQQIIDSIVGASTSYPGWGWSDWRNDRYIDLRCSNGPECFGNKTVEGQLKKIPLVSYFRPWKFYHDTYPTWTFCPAFFQHNIPSLAEAIANVESTPARKGWALALRSKGLDHYMTIGERWYRESVMVIDPGRAKLLAMVKDGGVKDAAFNNDNLVYFVLSEYMVMLYGSYPAKSRAWNPLLSSAENQYENESQFPKLKGSTVDGSSLTPDEFNLTSTEGWEGDFDDPPSSTTEVGNATGLTLQDLYTDADYPASYIATYGSVEASNESVVSSFGSAASKAPEAPDRPSRPLPGID